MNDPVNDSAATDAPRFAEDALARLLAFCDQPRDVDAIAQVLGVQPTEQLRDWLESLAFAGRLQRHKGKRYEAVKVPAVVGTYRRSRGYGARGGFVVPRDRQVQTIDIPEGLEEGAQEGDLVLASFKRGKGRGRRGSEYREGASGRVLSIIDARANEAAGIFEISHSGKPRVRLEGYNLPRYAYLQPHEVHRMKPGTIVRVKLLRKPDSKGGARAELVGSVGSIDNPLHDLDNLVALFGFPGEFSDEALEQVRGMPRDPDAKDFQGRVDLRQLPVITIDPKDAQDHDDAISVQQTGDYTLLGVHIADVAQYVTPGSPLDDDARFRATSVYLPGRLIAMLPKQLSQGLCSLHDSVDRLAKSCFIWFDAQGRVARRELFDSVVRVRRFLTYEEVLPVLTQGTKTGDDVVDALLTHGRTLADALQQRRITRGALTLEIPRAHVIVDKNGLVREISEEKTDPAHNLIEEFMLAANEAVAHFLLERGLPYIGRIHPAPEEDSVEDFHEFCEEMKLAKPDFDTPGDLQKFLDRTRGMPGGDAIHYALLRSLTRAIYHAGPELHYALAVRKYVHFTSPIRRYPDTATHQVLSEYFKIGGRLRWEHEPLNLPWIGPAGPTPPGKKIADFEQWEFSMPHIAAHCTERSIRADRGEQAANQIKILRTLIPRVGEAFHGTVIGVSAMNVTVRLDDLLAEGYVEFNELTDGWVEAHRFWAHYETSAGVRKVMLGDRMEVEIAGIDLPSRSLRLSPVGEHAKPQSWSRHRNRESRDRRKRKGDRRKRR